MPITATLLYSRRINTCDDPHPDPRSDSRRRRSMQERRHHDGHRPSFRPRAAGAQSPHAIRTFHHLAESEPFRVGLAASGRYGIPSSSNACTINARVYSWSSDEQLSSAVLQARSRVIQRLRGASLLGSLQTTSSLSTSDSESVNGRIHTNNSGDVHPFQELQPSWSDYGLSSTRHAEVLNVRKPPGLSCKALCCFQQEVFREAEQSEMMMRVQLECCICLERFQEGDNLYLLRCGHKFHQCCLEPWVRICGDCPFCRAVVVVE